MKENEKRQFDASKSKHHLNNGQKTLLLIIVVFAVMLVGYTAFIAFNKGKEKPKTEVADENISQELLKEKKFQGLELKDIDVESTSSLTHLMANVTNTANEKFPAGMVDIVFLDKDQKEIGRTETYIDEVEPKGQIRIDTVIDKDYKSAYTFKVEAKN